MNKPEWMSDSRMNKGHWNEWINQNEWVTPYLMSDSFFKEWLLFWKTATPLWMKWGSMPFFLPSLKFCLIIFVNKECYILPIKLTTNTGLTCITSRSDCPGAWLMFGVGPLSLDRWTDRTKANCWISEHAVAGYYSKVWRGWSFPKRCCTCVYEPALLLKGPCHEIFVHLLSFRGRGIDLCRA